MSLPLPVFVLYIRVYRVYLYDDVVYMYMNIYFRRNEGSNITTIARGWVLAVAGPLDFDLCQ